MEEFSQMIAAELKLPAHRIANTLKLLQGGATIPFISRYRKEATGGLDEVQIGDIQTRYEKLCELSKRKETVLSTIEEQGKLTPELKARISACWNATELEDIYLPFKPKRKTRAEAARAKGLEPLALLLMMQKENNLAAKVRNFVKGEVKDEEDFIEGMACEGGCVGGPSAFNDQISSKKNRDTLIGQADDRTIHDNLKNYDMESFSMHRE